MNTLLQKHLGKPLVVTLVGNENIRGDLAGISGSEILLHDRDIITAVSRNQVKSFSIEGVSEMPPYKPVLRFYAQSTRTQDAEVRIHYLTRGIGWSGEYVGVFNPEKEELNLKSWARLRNTSGNSLYADRLVLVAGEPNRAQRGRRGYPAEYDVLSVKQAAAAPQFEREEAVIYHKYTLNQPLDLGNNKEQKIRLFNEKNISVTQRFVFDIMNYGERVISLIEFDNNREEGIGEPLPAGAIKLYQRGRSGALYLGEDIIKNTPVDAHVSLIIGTAFDVTGKRIQKEYQRLDNRRRDETYEITLKNASDKNRDVSIIERFSGQWEIINSDKTYKKPDSRTAEFTVTVPAEGEAVLTYTVRYN